LSSWQIRKVREPAEIEYSSTALPAKPEHEEASQDLRIAAE